jgi:hypothetical protein
MIIFKVRYSPLQVPCSLGGGSGVVAGRRGGGAGKEKNRRESIADMFSVRTLFPATR